MVKIGQLHRNEVFRNITKLSLGNVLAQIVPVLFSPLIARLFKADDFGVYASLLTITSMLAVVANGRYELCVVLPKTDLEAKNLIIASWWIGFILSFCVSILLYLFASNISNYLGFNFGLFEIGLVSLLMLGMALWQPLNYYLIRKKAFAAIGTNKVAQTTSYTFITIFLGWLSLDNGLFIGYLVGFYFLVFFSLYQAFKLEFNFSGITFFSMKKLLVEYSSYSKYTAIPAFMNSIAGQLGVYVFLYYYTTEITGYYSFAKQYIFVPMGIIGVSMSQVYYQRISEKYAHKQGILQEVKFLFLGLLGLGILAVIFINLFGTSLFVLVFGEDWKQAGIFSEMLIYYFAFQFLVSPLSNILYALKEVKLAAIFPVVYLASMILLFFLPKLAVEEFLVYYVFAEAFPYLIYLGLIFYAVHAYEKGLTQINKTH